MNYKLLLCVLALLLTACGGGDPEPEECAYNQQQSDSVREQPQWIARCEAN